MPTTSPEAHDEGPYLLGQRFTTADLYLSGQLGFGLMMKGLDPRPVFHAYVERIQGRPAYQRMTEQAAELSARMKAAS